MFEFIKEEVMKLEDHHLDRKVSELRTEIFKMKMQKTTSGIEKPHLIKVAKKNIARLLTVKNSRKQGK